jgi:hypothetical protein
MKRALISKLENDRICEIQEIGNEFEVSPDFEWIDCPDEITPFFIYKREDNTFKPFNIVEVEGFKENGYKVARQIAYGNIGDQLDMIYKEIQSTGVISSQGDWALKIANVKATIPKDDPYAVQAWNEEYNNLSKI